MYPQGLYNELLTSKMIDLEDGALGSWLGREGKTLKKGFVWLQRNPSLLIPCELVTQTADILAP